jgi:putative ABC transport system permease protein
MFINYLLIAFRNLAKYKVFSIINISGMALSLASCMLIALFVTEELSFDQHHPDADRTYRVYNTVTQENAERNLPITPYPYASYMQKDFPEIESTLRILDTYETQLFQLGDKKTKEAHGLIGESGIFDMLSLQVIAGEPDSALTRPGTVVLSQTLAKKYFNDLNPIGKSIKIDNLDREITAVFADAPEHMHLKISYVTSLSSTNWHKRAENNFVRQQFFTYLKLRPGTDPKDLEEKLVGFIDKYATPQIKDAGTAYVAHLQNIRDIHLYSSSFEWEVAQRGDAQSVYILMATAITILIIACLNFINLSTARAVKRMKEVGIRKTTGAMRGQLIFQFLSESILFTFLGLVLAVVVAELALPSLNAVVEKNLSISYNPLYIIGALGFCAFIGALAGGYPAIYLSGFRPAAVLAKRREKPGGSGVFRQSLVVVQFMLSFFLIAASLIILSQNELIKTKDLGFQREHIVMIPLRPPHMSNLELTKQRAKANPNVVNATIAFGLPGDIVAGDGVKDPVTGKEWLSSMFCVDFDYITTLDMKIIAGRGFSRDFPSDSTDGFVVNETFLSTYGLGTPDEAVGKKLDWNRWDGRGLKHGKIIGVVKDFHFKSLRDKLTPIVMNIWPDATWKLVVKINAQDVPGTIAHLKNVYESMDPDWVFSYSFMDQQLDEMYKSEQRLGKLFVIFTYLAIAVACLGLFGLVEYSVNQRSKEISIRKVFGASLSSLLFLLTRKYFLMLAISILIVAPIVWYSAEKWLSRFAYQIDLEPMLFIKSAAVILLITAITVSFQSIRAGLANPIRNLRND